MFFKYSLTIFLCLFASLTIAQQDSTEKKIQFNADVRFRVEQDWHSKKQDGTFREDRSRLRYRGRIAATYKEKWYEAGLRIRTGNPAKQQDPHVTIGKGLGEFGGNLISIDKAYWKGQLNSFEFWLGKNTFPFEKSNELFWSDNVNPEGIFVKKRVHVESSFIDFIDINLGHFIASSSGGTFNSDGYFQGLQTYIQFKNKQVEVFPSIYIFKNINGIPDNKDSYQINYAIAHIGSRFLLIKKPMIRLELDGYMNVQSYNENDFVSSDFEDQKKGVVFGIQYGALKNKKDWLFKTSFAYLERYAIVDYFAQNDWVRWDYSSQGSSDGRLSNFKGVECVLGYKLDDKVKLKAKYYIVEQLIPLGQSKENGNRIRFDVDIAF